jgi:predicted anti-sigma-YlaC factor YlaD
VDCSEVLQQLADYLDEEARDELCRAIEQHLGQCRDCRLYVDTVRKTIVLYQSDAQVELPDGVSSALQTALGREYRRAKSGAPAD